MISTTLGLVLIGAGSLVAIALGAQPEPKSEIEDETYNYWYNLNDIEREEYFNSNEYLKSYGDKYYYKDKHLMAKSASEIAKKENRSFTDRYNRY